MSKIRHVFPGGNTRYGFYSFYKYMVGPQVQRKYILKGGPGVGKSVFIKKMGEHFYAKGVDVEWHWCSSDSHSLDGVVLGQQQICFLDGTSPHTVDPIYPGAVDEIINLGDFWDRDQLIAHRTEILDLTRFISSCFQKAYMRLKETGCAYEEWKSYYREARDDKAIQRNIAALGEDFLQGTVSSSYLPRHLFPGAITPDGLVNKIDCILEKDHEIFAVRGSPGSGIKELFQYVYNLIEVHSVYGEVFHNPFDPHEIDLIILPDSKSALIDVSPVFFHYGDQIPGKKYRRQLDFDQFIYQPLLDPWSKSVAAAHERVDTGLKDAVLFIQMAKTYHDELEQYYLTAMDFAAIEQLRQKLAGEIEPLLD